MSMWRKRKQTHPEETDSRPPEPVSMEDPHMELLERAIQAHVTDHPVPPQRPVIPSATTATRRVDMSDAEVSVQEEILAVAEDFANYVAARGRGISVATPARRRLREEIERVVLAFVRTAEPPAALDKRAEARVLEIVRQTLASQISPPEDQSLRTQNGEEGHIEVTVSQDPPPPPPYSPDSFDKIATS